MKTQTTESPFESALHSEIRKRIKSYRADGTVSMSVDNLMQCVRSPSPCLVGAPAGTNARYYYAEMFRRICRESPDIAGFIRGCQ